MTRDARFHHPTSVLVLVWYLHTQPTMADIAPSTVRMLLARQSDTSSTSLGDSTGDKFLSLIASPFGSQVWLHSEYVDCWISH